jgi:uncharacterized protein involved in exopolysaccharide biosynthesis
MGKSQEGNAYREPSFEEMADRRWQYRTHDNTEVSRLRQQLAAAERQIEMLKQAHNDLTIRLGRMATASD